MDLDGHGHVGEADIRRVIALVGDPEPNQVEVQEMIRIMDPNGNGTIEFSEFTDHFMDPPLLWRDFDVHNLSGESEGAFVAAQAAAKSALPPSLIAAVAKAKATSKLSAGSRSPGSTSNTTASSTALKSPQRPAAST